MNRSPELHPRLRVPRMRLLQLGLASLLTVGLVLSLWWGLDQANTHPWLFALVLGLFAVNAFWLSAAACASLIGLFSRAPQPDRIECKNAPGRCAALWLVCGEDPELLARRIRDFATGLEATGQAASCDIYVLSDTQGKGPLSREAAALAGLGDLVRYRNRTHPDGRKPGNLADWLAEHGADYETMLVLDADSGFSAARLAGLRAQMAAKPRLGLVQCAIRLRPGHSRFAAMQRLSGRICGPGFARGLARMSGDAGNYWGHNALIRTRAFAEVARLPRLRGQAPMGGEILSHDFIEAAFLRRAGWEVVIDPDSRGSFEDAPETMATHLRRDRRWAQGNLQHVRLIAARGLHPVSRMHLLGGIQSYLSAPVWLALVLLFGSGAVHASPGAVVPLSATLALLMVPKLAGRIALRPHAGGRWRRRVLRRALGAELALTTVFAPLLMLRQTGFVAAVLSGRDSGWRPAGSLADVTGRQGRAEALGGFAILLAVTIPQATLGTGGWSAAALAALMVLPVTLPLMAAPWLIPWLDAPVRKGAGDRIADYYDASTRRFLSMGGSGAALAIHRPLWAEGVTTAPEAAAHVNTLVAEAAHNALGRAPERVCDLGCGVGGTLFHLAPRWPEARLTGLTLSAEQVRIARLHSKARGLDERVQVVQSDFSHPPTLPRADLVLAIESHVHAQSARDFLRAAKSHLRPGGVLVIVDDMLSDTARPLDARAQRMVATFRRGWRLGHVSAPSDLLAEAARLGYDPVSSQDLSPYLRLDRLRDRALRYVGPLADFLCMGRFALFANMIGGNALTQAHLTGILQYHLVVLRARAAAQSDMPGPVAQSAA